MYECVKSFCYLRDTLDGDGEADLAAIARIRNGWMDEVPRAFAISDIQSSHVGDERSRFQRSQPTRGGTVWQQQIPANRDQHLS